MKKITSTALGIGLGAGVLTLGLGTANAGGFFLDEHDAAAVGRGNAVTATNDGASSIAYNPAGIALGEGTDVLIGGSLIYHDETFHQDGGGTTHSTEDPSVIPQLFVSHRINDLIAVGIGLHTPFAAEIDWPASSPQANIIREQQIETFFISPTIGFNLNKYVPGLSLAGGLDIVPASVDLKQDIYFGDQTGTAHLGGTALGFGGRAGVIYAPPAIPQLSLGASWHSEVKLDFTGNGNFDAPAPFRSQLPPDGAISTSITMPQAFTGGVAVRPTKRLELEADVSWMGWSSFKQLAVKLPDGTTQTSARDYTDTVQVRVGVQADLPELHSIFRFGYIYDPSPVPAAHLDATLPDIDRNDLTVGWSVHCHGLEISAAFLYVIPGSRVTGTAPNEPEYKGTFDASAWVASLSLSKRFGAHHHEAK